MTQSSEAILRLGPDETSPAMSPRQEDQEGGIGEGFTQAHDFC